VGFWVWSYVMHESGIMRDLDCFLVVSEVGLQLSVSKRCGLGRDTLMVRLYFVSGKKNNKDRKFT